MATQTQGQGATEAKATTQPTASKVDLGLLEEDDDFEEFPADDWPEKAGEEEEEVKVWEDNWDDDNIEDDFSTQLKAELEKQGYTNLDGKGAQQKK